MMPGNRYELTQTASGIPTFRHLQTGELLHGQVGPYEEARQLYVNASGLSSLTGSAVVYDVGMGCAAQVLAAMDTFLANANLRSLRILSFDLEKEGLRALLAHLDYFPFAQPHADVLNQMADSDHVEMALEDGRSLSWHFIGGDFRETLKNFSSQSVPSVIQNAPADYIFYDFFSPASHPYLWTFPMFSQLYTLTSPRAKILTYSSATAVKAAIAAAGFFVGVTHPSGKRAKSTIGARSLDDLTEPLPWSWLGTFLRSHAQFTSAETDRDKEEIVKRLCHHPQFKR